MADLCVSKEFNMKKLVFIGLIGMVVFAISCGGDAKTEQSSESTDAPKSMVEDSPKGPEGYDPKRGEGKFTAESLKLDATVDESKAKAGETVTGVKCASCHKLSDEKLVGPGWKGVTTRRAPEWIMNFITNPDPMIEKDPEVQAQLELCLVRMPNQGLTDEDARNILEFMRKNDQ